MRQQPMESATNSPASMSKGESASSDHARESLPRSPTSSQQDAITALIEQWRRLANGPEGGRRMDIGSRSGCRL